MLQHLKNFWKHYVAASVIVPSAFAAGLEVGANKSASFDCKGTDCQVQVFVKKPHFQDAIYYKPDQWNTKTQADLDNDEQSRFDKWDALVQEQSKATSSDEQVPQN